VPITLKIILIKAIINFYMDFKNQKSVTPSQRHLVQLNLSHLNKKPVIKNKLKGLVKANGRNHSGKITVFHKGGGHKKRYRIISFNRSNESIGIAISIEYDPNRNANIASIFDFMSGNFFYIISPEELEKGDIIKSGLNIELSLGNSLPLSKIPEGSLIYNVSIKKYNPSILTRSAGTFAIYKEKKKDDATIVLSSGKQIEVSVECFATIGVVSNGAILQTQLGKAGRARWLNRRPTVRGVAMNPIDHPHGGGEGRKSGKGKTPWGKTSKKGPICNKNKLNFLENSESLKVNE
jgi:large subunit ribosomal protein L2